MHPINSSYNPPTLSTGCKDPDESGLSAEEIRPFLNAHFLCCRALSKIIHASDVPSAKRSEPLVIYLFNTSL